MRDAFADIDPADVTPEMLQQMLAMAGANGSALPTRMAEINEILNALPAELTEALLTEYMNELHTQPRPTGWSLKCLIRARAQARARVEPDRRELPARRFGRPISD